VRLDDHDRPRLEVVFDPTEVRQNQSSLGSSPSVVFTTEEDEGRPSGSGLDQQATEVRIAGDHDPVVVKGTDEHRLIGGFE
jgi:hypothetical protein